MSAPIPQKTIAKVAKETAKVAKGLSLRPLRLS
jgi:hypothetical protein